MKEHEDPVLKSLEKEMSDLRQSKKGVLDELKNVTDRNEQVRLQKLVKELNRLEHQQVEKIAAEKKKLKWYRNYGQAPTRSDSNLFDQYAKFIPGGRTSKR